MRKRQKTQPLEISAVMTKEQLIPEVSDQKKRQLKKRSLILACSGFLIMALGLPFIDGMSLTSWLMVIASTVIVWVLLWLFLFFKLDKYLPFDPHFLLTPAAFSALLICYFIHILPELRILFLSGWFAVLLFGTGLFSFKNAMVLNTIMISAHIGNILLLIKLGTPLTFLSEMGIFTPYIIMWSYLAVILEQVRKRRDENKEMRLMLSDLLIKKEELLSDVSHELTTPLTVLKLQVEALKDGIEDDVEAAYEAIDAKLNDLEKIVADIQLSSQPGELKLDFSEFNLSKTIQDWLPELQLSASRSQLSFNFINKLPDDITAFYDPNKVKQVITNIFANSVKYTDVPGSIHFTAKSIDNKLHLIIEDSAPDLHDKHLSKIFDRLYRVDNSRSRETGGSGLGLAICKSIVLGHNGAIWASHSELGGLKVTVELPLEN